MVSPPSSSSEAIQNGEKPPASLESDSTPTNNIQYADTAVDKTTELDTGVPAKRTGRWTPWKKFLEGQKSDWWFASTAVPLLAATLGPLANVLSICALVTSWRETVYVDGKFVPDFSGIPFPDPKWCYWLNVVSLITGFLGNVFLLLNFTQRVRYLICLPATIILWYISTGFLIAITACMEIYSPPNRPFETYTQGFWYAIAAASMYLICSMILMLNMLGYFLGHYPDHFALTDAQRTLILQTMMFFIWLAGGGAVFSRIEHNAGEQGWAFSDSLYFCDVTILTVGFGDLYPTTDLGRGIVFPYSVGGIITLGLVISAIYKFMRQLGEEKIVEKHLEKMRVRYASNTVDNSFDLRQREHADRRSLRHRRPAANDKIEISAPSERRPFRTPMGHVAHRAATMKPSIRRKPRLILLREEKDRFEAMRKLQHKTDKFKKWYSLVFSFFAFAFLWCIGAVVFWECEKNAQGMTYFQALYFCYVSLLTIGYGDLAPKSNAGRCFFVVWSLIAVPTMTILVSNMGDTVVAKFKNWSDDLADFTVLPKAGIWRDFLERHPWLLNWLQTWQEKRAAKRRLARGFEVEDPAEIEEADDVDDPDSTDTVQHTATLSTLATEIEHDRSGKPPTSENICRRLAVSIRRVATDLGRHIPKKYDYEEWVEFTRLIRFAQNNAGEKGEGVLEEEDTEGLVDWDWIGEDSPLMSAKSESEWLLEKLTESLVRLEKRRETTLRLREATAGRGDRRVHDKDTDRERQDQGDNAEADSESGGNKEKAETEGVDTDNKHEKSLVSGANG